MRRREVRGAEKRNKGCGEEKTLYFGATVLEATMSAPLTLPAPRWSVCETYTLGVCGSLPHLWVSQYVHKVMCISNRYRAMYTHQYTGYT